MASISPVPKLQFFDNNGNPLSGGKLYTYAAGTTTPQATYTTAGGTIPNANPVILNSRGEASVWLGTLEYKMKLTTSTDVEIWTVDNINGADGATLAALAASSGSAYIGFIQSGTSAVARTVQSKLREWATPEDFGAIGNGSVDDTTALQAMFAAHTYIRFPDSSKTYKVTSTITLQSGTMMIGDGAIIQMFTANTTIFDISNKSDISVEGLSFVGFGADFTNSVNSLAMAFYSTGGSARLRFHKNKFTSFSYCTVAIYGGTDVEFCNNIVVGIGAGVHPTGIIPITDGGSYGFLTDTGSNRVLVDGNVISQTAQGLRIEGTQNIRISNNYIYSIVGQHGMYIGSNMVNCTVVGNIIVQPELIGIKIQAQNTASTNNLNITIASNVIYGCVAGDGIAILNGAGSAAQPVTNNSVTITGNVLRDIKAYGIAIQNTYNANISSNVILNTEESAILIGASGFLSITNNEIATTYKSAIRDQDACQNIVIRGNIINNAAFAVSAGDRYGIFVNNATAYEINDNTISDSNAKMQYGIYIAGGSPATQSIYDNVITASTDYAIRFAASSEGIRKYTGNVLNGTLGLSFNNPALPTVASAATISLPTGMNVINITGTTNISTINAAGHANHIVTLIFADVLTVVRGSNLKLSQGSGSFTTTALDTLTLASDGDNWYEISRSVN
jgi:parallel beta-helix repeat protein